MISGFGLSAFLFSTIAHVGFPGDTSTFLLILAIGSSLPFIPGFFLVRPIPLPPSEQHPESGRSYDYEPVFQNEENGGHSSDEEGPTRSTMYGKANESHARLLGQEEEDETFADEMTETDALHRPLPHTATSVELHLPSSPSIDSSPIIPTPRRGSLPLSPTRGSGSRHRTRNSITSSGRHRHGSPRTGNDGPSGPNLTGLRLARSKMFWILFTMTSLRTYQFLGLSRTLSFIDRRFCLGIL